MAHFEKTISSKTVYEGNIFRVISDRVELENGGSSQRDIVLHNGGVCIAPFDSDGRLILVRQFRYAMGEEVLEFPAGKLERSEQPALAAMRELGEEIGMAAGELVPLGPVYPTVGYSSEIIWCFRAAKLTPITAHPDDDEFLTIEKYTLREAERFAREGVIRDAKTLALLYRLAID